jgi:hypothetical protein
MKDKPMTYAEVIERFEDIFRLVSNVGNYGIVKELIPYLKEKYSIEINPNVTDGHHNYHFFKK